MSQTHKHLRYRPDIDGLRALAVIPVVLFHVGLGCPGGYVGVDVFFVISGFLITAIILKNVHQGSFSMLGFWERRIRRILPALALVVMATIIGAWVVLYPSQFRDFGKETVAQATLVSNFYFFKQDGYFDAPSEHLPFLHTWSLAVEEQFYVVFPLVLYFLHRKGKKLVLWMSILAGLSFFWSAYGVVVFPEATFFLLPARAWELLLGSLLATHFTRSDGKNPLARSVFSTELLSWLGLGLILYSVSAYSYATPFPGPTALVPCLGAALLIFANRTRVSSVGRLLSLPPVVLVGKISYSIYLWHWPLMVFTKYAAVGELTLPTRIGIAGASIFLAYLSWKFIETPFRRPDFITSRKMIFRFFYASTALFVVLGTVIYKNDGFSSRFSKEVTDYLDVYSEEGLNEMEYGGTTGTLPLINESDKDAKVLPVLLWGDSHAGVIAPVFRKLCRESGTNFHVAPCLSMPPLLGVCCPPKSENPEYNDAVLSFIIQNKIQSVILAARWAYYSQGDPNERIPAPLVNPAHPKMSASEAFQSSFNETIAKLKEAGVQVWILKQVPCQDLHPPSALANAVRYGRKNKMDFESFGVTAENHLDRQLFSNNIIDSLADEQVRILDPLPYLRTASDHCRMGMNGRSLYIDRDHLSELGAMQLLPLYAPLFAEWSSRGSND